MLLGFYIALTAHAAAPVAEPDTPRFIKLDGHGLPLVEQQAPWHVLPWACVLDQRTGLIWQIRTGSENPRHDKRLTFTWYSNAPDEHGGNQGSPDTPNTRTYIQTTNADRWCNAADWRLPQREELRSLVDYARAYPGPTIDTHYFPDALAQFYWSANSDANDPQSAWGIGFSFGFDYAYFKGDRVSVRLVRGPRP